MNRKLLILGIIAAMSLTGAVANAQGSFEVLPFGGSFFGNWVITNFDGTVVASNTGTPFFYDVMTGTYTYCNDPTFQGPQNISGDGMWMIGTAPNLDGFNQGARWSMATGTDFVPLVPNAESCDASISSGYDLNFDGSVAVGLAWVPTCDAEAFKWTDPDAAAVTLGTSGNSSRATGVSQDGSTTVGFDEHPAQGYRRPAIWTDDVTGPQLILGEDTAGECYAASSNGYHVCGVANTFAFYWNPDVGYVDIGFLPGDEFYGSIALAVSDDGKVVGYSGNPFFSTPRAFIWTVETGIVEMGEYFTAEGLIGYEGQQLYRGLDISEDGQTIVGNWVNLDTFLIEDFIAHLGSVAIEDDQPQAEDTPDRVTALNGAFPNPFNPMTTVSFTLAQAQQVKLSVFDMSGRRVVDLADDTFEAGEHPVQWTGRDSAGQEVPSGTYIVHMITAEGVRSSKMTLVR